MRNLIKNFAEKGAWAYPGTAQFFWYPLLSQEQVKLRTSNFVRIFTGSIRLSKQKSIKNVGKSSRERSQGLAKIFTAAIYRAHREVFAIAQLSCKKNRHGPSLLTRPIFAHPRALQIKQNMKCFTERRRTLRIKQCGYNADTKYDALITFEPKNYTK